MLLQQRNGFDIVPLHRQRPHGPVQEHQLRFKGLLPLPQQLPLLLKRCHLCLQRGDALKPGQRTAYCLDPCVEFVCNTLGLLNGDAQLLHLVVAHQLYVSLFSPQVSESVAFHLPALVDGDRYPTVYLRAGDLFQDGGTFIGWCLQKRRKTTLGQEHRARKALKVHAGPFLYLSSHVLELGLKELSGLVIGYLVFGSLEFAIGSHACAALAPVTHEGAPLGLKHHLGHALSPPAGHDLVGLLCDLAQAGRLSVERQAYGIKDGGLARPRRPGDHKYPAVGIRRVRKVNHPLPHQRIQVL
ncbi:hypothetical protein MBAV_000650 [Candidatus Magnetobacterium bavaricum]|uniref:Uncharacterized protein n=1 Tax=Candidatus Magnetobacterium bavaricum TaxID=29290 RepID=A0A0F3H2I6_9BACT|nr:hypothetical protein MBAV_000650 [Candidatus Magnetobacterium bavaricum]